MIAVMPIATTIEEFLKSVLPAATVPEDTTR